MFTVLIQMAFLKHINSACQYSFLSLEIYVLYPSNVHHSSETLNYKKKIQNHKKEFTFNLLELMHQIIPYSISTKIDIYQGKYSTIRLLCFI